MGYKSEQFVKRVDENLHCPICHEVFKDPVSCTDGHAFCSTCIKEWLKTHKRCPSDNRLLEAKKLVRLLAVKGIVDNLDVYCHPQDNDENTEPKAKKIKHKKRGEKKNTDICDWMGKLQELEKHRKICQFQQVQCPHTKCSETIQRSDIESHKKICKYKVVTCEECGCKIVQANLENHKATKCRNALIPCPNSCSTNGKITKLKRSDLKDHLHNECDEESVPCPFEDQGCTKQILRKEKVKHLQEDTSLHMLLIAKQNTLLKKENFLLAKQNEKLNTLLKKENSLLAQKNEKLKNELTEVKANLKDLKEDLSLNQANLSDLKEELSSADKCTYIWTIGDYPSHAKKYPNGSFFRSPSFWLCGYSWYLMIYPNGDSRAEGFLSLFLCLKDDKQLSTNTLVVPSNELSASYSISVISQNPAVDDVSIGSEVKVFKKHGWGYIQFMKAHDVLSPSYCNSTNGSLTIQCTIQLDKPH